MLLCYSKPSLSVVIINRLLSLVLLSLLLTRLILLIIRLLSRSSLAHILLLLGRLLLLLLLLVIPILILLHPAHIVLFGRFICIVLSIRIDSLRFQICPSLLLSHDICVAGGVLHLLGATLIILFAVFGGARLSPCSVDFTLVTTSHISLQKIQL